MFVGSFGVRKDLSKRLEDAILKIFVDEGFHVIPYGFEKISEKMGISPGIQKILKDEKYKNKNAVIMMLRYAPDCVVVNPDIEPEKGVFFLEIKASITPLYFDKHIERLRTVSGYHDLQRHDIGEIEREAFEVYKEYYPSNSICLIMGCVYNPKVLLADWVSNIEDLYKLGVNRNIYAEGSGTPHVNIHLGKMRSLENFMKDEFGIEISCLDSYQDALKLVKSWRLNAPSWLDPTIYKRVCEELRKICPWISCK